MGCMDTVQIRPVQIWAHLFLMLSVFCAWLERHECGKRTSMKWSNTTCTRTGMIRDIYKYIPLPTSIAGGRTWPAPAGCGPWAPHCSFPAVWPGAQAPHFAPDDAGQHVVRHLSAHAVLQNSSPQGAHKHASTGQNWTLLTLYSHISCSWIASLARASASIVAQSTTDAVQSLAVSETILRRASVNLYSASHILFRMCRQRLWQAQRVRRYCRNLPPVIHQILQLAVDFPDGMAPRTTFRS